MKIKIFPAAEARIKEVRHYTKKLWGNEQARKYVRGLGKAINELPAKQNFWRNVSDDKLIGIFYIRYEHHHIFFRRTSKGIGVISVLHESMDIPSRLKEDSNKI